MQSMVKVRAPFCFYHHSILRHRIMEMGNFPYPVYCVVFHTLSILDTVDIGYQNRFRSMVSLQSDLGFL